jgi:K+-transporting ATPase A subunit
MQDSHTLIGGLPPMTLIRLGAVISGDPGSGLQGPLAEQTLR